MQILKENESCTEGTGKWLLLETFIDFFLTYIYILQDIFILFSDVCAYRLNPILLHMCNDSKDIIIMLIWSHMGGHDNPVSVLR